MKKHLNKKALWLSILSLAVLGIFILLAIGSDVVMEAVPDDAKELIDIPNPKIESVAKDNGEIEKTQYLSSNLYANVTMTTTGKQDGAGRWQGKVRHSLESWRVINGEIFHYCEISENNMVDGKLCGLSMMYWPDRPQDDTIYYCYSMDKPVPCCGNKDAPYPCKKSSGNITAYTSAFQVLENKYPWFLSTLNLIGFNNAYLEAYLDTLEIIMNTLEFDESEFDDEYEDVLDELEKTPYDSIIVLNSDFAFLRGLDELKNNELRLAVIRRQRSEGSHTYNIVETVFPGYLQFINDMEISNQDFEGFCQDLDSCMDTYGDPDPEDPLFCDSVDVHLIRALVSIMNTEDTTASSAKRLMKSTAVRNSTNKFSSIVGIAGAALDYYLATSDPSEVGMVVLLHMLQQYSQGDIMRQSVKEAWLNRKGIIRVPTIATVFLSNISATSVTLQGNVIEDGGGAVTSRGIAWATFYNPTLDDNIETHGAGTGIFNVTLNGLAEGTTYYARAWAVNGADTAYGNCIEFVAAKPSGIDKVVKADGNFRIFPNPVSATATISFNLAIPGNVRLNIIDMKGQQVLNKELGRLPQGSNQIKLDLSGLQSGMYICRLSYGSSEVTSRFTVAR